MIGAAKLSKKEVFVPDFESDVSDISLSFPQVRKYDICTAQEGLHGRVECKVDCWI